MKGDPRKLFLVVLVFALWGCDDLAYSSGEVRAKRSYEAVDVGTSRELVEKKLGAPAYELSWNASQNKYEYRADGKSVVFQLTFEATKDLPPELRFVPMDMRSPTVLIYSAGTVFGYIGLDLSNRVSLVKVVVS
jgi:hypothetical protein